MREELKFGSQNAQLAWEATARLLTEEVPYNGDILARMKSGSKDNPLTLFIPWGVRPEGNFGSSELQALDFVQNYRQLLTGYCIPNNVLLMPADVYAIEINGYKWETTTAYFSRVWVEAEKRNFQVLPWSVIRKQNRARYETVLQWEANPESLWRSIPKSLWYQNLLMAAYRRSAQKGDSAITKAAFDYLKERIAEARVIESVYRPIKLSMVSPKKDDVVDCDLPRLYILPRNLRFPWIDGRGI
ncbi:MAG: hypothetical protein UY49_C0015G0008 [Microgenomates group bacterium GW2011_GWC1_49_7]|nr:MAG: hypothetical protein UY49_C0015G0008 [Microgenomates group bacterium GW2011_GWC1_49_7]